MENEKNPIYEIIGKIESVEEKARTTGEAFKKIKINGMTFNIFDSKWFDFLHIGEIINAKYNKTTSGDYTYKNIFFIIKATEADITKPTVQQNNLKSNKEVDWDAKEKKIVKQNVLNRSVDMYLADKIKREDILKTADNFLDWVYDKFPKKEKIRTLDEIENINVTEEKIE